ncbi:AAA family ATPase [Phenylobacterium sp.]|uniref:nSTAND1 domain-containing NTPase n=1 Tax=Phenylobacterium sp. TaxID=1871053 RepID=UPI002732CA6C|nr:AAA family ATPase [Phenylobacterium sp.]MDP3853499.1 AAA family ATPase [Phenylobacterium sp.]
MSWINRLLGRKPKPAQGVQSGPVFSVAPLTATGRDDAKAKKAGSAAMFPRFQSTAGDQLSPRITDRFAATRIKLRSAFTPSQPITDRRMFAGRTDVLTTLIRSLEDQRVHVIMYGERGIGKTSLVHVLTQAAQDARYIVVYCSCGAGSNFEEIFRAVAADIPLLFHSGFAPTAEQAERGGSLADLLPAGPLSPRTVADLFAKLTGTRVLVVLDEFDVCENPEFRRNIAELIKNLSDRSIRTQLVIAGVAADLTELVEHIPSIRRNIFALQVPKMTAAEISHLVENGEEISGVAFDRSALDFIVFVANGSPYLASLLSHHSGLAALDKARTKVSVEDVSLAVDQALAEFRGRISKHAQAQIDQAAKSGVRHVLGVMAGAALFNNGRFDGRDVDALYPSAATAANFKNTVQELADKGVLLEAHDDDYGKGYKFSEESVLPYLWILAAQKRFLESRKPTPAPEKAAPEKPVAEKTPDKASEKAGAKDEPVAAPVRAAARQG